MLRRLINSLDDYFFTNSEIMENTTKSLELLTRGFSRDLAQFVFEDERFMDLLMEATSEFIDKNIPIDEESKYELGMMMLDTITVESRM